MPRRKVVRRKRGRGLGEILGNLGSGVGTGVGSGIRNIFSSLFGGRKRRVPRRKGRGPSLRRLFLGGLGRKRVHRKRGRGDVLSKINKIAKESQIVSKALNEFGNPFGLGGIAGTLGYGRRKRSYRRRRGGMAHSMFIRPMMGGGNLNF